MNRLPFLEAGLLAGAGAALINLLLARLIARLLMAPPTFAPLTAPPVLLGSAVGAFGATCVYGLLSQLLPHPLGVIYVLTGLLLSASAYLPLRLLQDRPRRTDRFLGATPAIAIALFGLHSVVACVSLWMLRYWLPAA